MRYRVRIAHLLNRAAAFLRGHSHLAAPLKECLFRVARQNTVSATHNPGIIGPPELLRESYNETCPP